MNEITSISDVVSILKELQQPDPEKTRFFRGQADKSWDLLPSIYRKDKPNLIKSEDKIIKDAFTNCPDDFTPSDTLFEKLVKLQHYGYRTRLLDLTTNALVALYFACWEEKHYDKDGELVILDIPDEKIKYDDSDTVAILSAISLQSEGFSILEANKTAKTQQSIAENTYLLDNANPVKIDNFKKLKQFLEDNHYSDDEKIMDVEKYLELIRQASLDISKEKFLEAFNQDQKILQLIHTIHTDKPSFRPVIESSDLSRVLCVRAKMNNARISRQQGCFLIYGINENKLSPATVPNDWLKKSSQNEKFIIKAENKKEILQELKSFGISTRILFPELEKQAEEIMFQYSNIQE